jgi:hypothetical protein
MSNLYGNLNQNRFIGFLFMIFMEADKIIFFIFLQKSYRL